MANSHNCIDDIGPFASGPLSTWNVVADRSPKGARANGPAHKADAQALVSSTKAVNDGFEISFAKLARFHLNFDRQVVSVFEVGDAASQATLTHLLCDHIAPRILAHQGALVLHGSAVSIDGKVAVFIGDTGTGKSTLAASLHGAGHQLLGDDAVVILQGETGFLAEAVYPSLRLFHDSIAAIVEDNARTEPMAHYSDKQRVTLARGAQSGSRPLPLGGLFLLSGDADAATIAVRKPSPAQACVAILEQSFSLDAHDGAQAARRMAMASKLIGGIATFELEYPNGFDRLSQVHSLIETCMSDRNMASAGVV